MQWQTCWCCWLASCCQISWAWTISSSPCHLNWARSSRKAMAPFCLSAREMATHPSQISSRFEKWRSDVKRPIRRNSAWTCFGIRAGARTRMVIWKQKAYSWASYWCYCFLCRLRRRTPWWSSRNALVVSSLLAAFFFDYDSINFIWEDSDVIIDIFVGQLWTNWMTTI